MKRRVPRPDSTDFVPLLLGGTAGAVWMLLFTAGVAEADDCLKYVQEVKNFVTIPKGLLEDCMRTGSVQAIITAMLGAGGGGAVAIAVNKGLKDAAKGDGDATGPKVVTDPKTTEEEKGGKTPEGVPPTQSRDGTPEACRRLYDDFKTALANAEVQGRAVETVKARYWRAFRNHQNNLAKLTIQLGMDAADFAQAGASGIKGGMGIARAIAEAPTILADLITKTAARSGSLAVRLAALLEDIAEIAGRATRAAAKIDDIGRLSAEAESKFITIGGEAAALERNMGELEGFARTARSADAAAAERNALMTSITEAEDALEAQRSAMKRKQGLQDWADGERAAIRNEDARAFAAKQEELHNLRDKLAEMRKKHAEAAEAARVDWQNKMGEMRQAKVELDEINQKRLREQSTAQVKDEAALRVKDAEAELAAFDEKELATFRAAREERIRKAKANLAEKKQEMVQPKRDDKAAREALAEFDEELDNLEPDLAKVDPDVLAERAVLEQAYLDAENRLAHAQQAVNDWKAANPDALFVPGDVPGDPGGMLNVAGGDVRKAHRELANFDAELKINAPPIPTPEEVAKREALRLAHVEASERLQVAEKNLNDAVFQLEDANLATPEREQTLSRQQSAAERAPYEKEVNDARKQFDLAEKKRAEFQAEFEAMGGNEELSNRWAKYNRLSQEGDDLRVLHEDLRSGSFEDEFSEFDGRKTRLEGELENWKEPDWEQVAGERNPDKLAEWKSEVGGTNPRAEAEATLKPYEDRVKDLQGQEAALEKKLNEIRDQLPSGKNTQSIESELQSVKADLERKKEELKTLREAESKTKAELADEQERLKKANEEKATKEAELERTKKAKEDNDADLRILEGQKDKPPKDIFDSLSSTSRSMREGFDEMLDMAIPGPIKWPFQGLKWMGGKAGELFHWGFGGQSPEEIAKIIKDGDAQVKETSKWLADTEAEYEVRLQRVRDLRGEFDRCVAINK